jgi:hypothetical protein
MLKSMVEPFQLYAKPAFGTRCRFITFALFHDKTPAPDTDFREGYPGVGTVIAKFNHNGTGLIESAARFFPVVVRPNGGVPIV